MLRIFRRSAIMWKTFYLLALISTLDFPLAIRADDEPIEPRAEFLKRNEGRKSSPEVRRALGTYDGLDSEDDYRQPSNQKEILHVRPYEEEREATRPRPYSRETEEFRRRPYERENEHPALIGKWRNNGEALEPEWRDGDSMPLYPFTHFSGSRSKDDKGDDEYESREDDDIIEPRYRVSNNRHIRLRPNNDKRFPENDEYEDEELPRKSEQSRDPERRVSNKLKTTLDLAEITAGSRETNRDHSQGSFKEQVASMRYREAFQMSSNAYEQELNDEEYLKPRPRKRRPPQNYEFALAANEAATRERNSSPRPLTHLNGQGDTSSATTIEPARKKNVLRGRLSENALELKSLLKMQQEEGLSLSEILQRRNLTLHDLLKGKADIISVLKAKDIDETLEDMEEVSKAMSHSLMKLAVTENPQRTITALPEELRKSETQYRVSLSIGPKVTKQTVSLQVESTTPYLSKESTTIQSNNSNDVESAGLSLNSESALATKTVFITLKPPLTHNRGTTKVFSTSTPTMVTEQSMKDDNKTKSKNIDKAETDNLDEDEIMEFSDFPGFKKTKSNSVASDWADVVIEQKTVGRVDLQDDEQDIGSTLSIEHILSPTEQPITNESNDNNVQNKHPTLIDDFPANEFNEFSEIEYLNDSPLEILEEDKSVTNATNAANIPKVSHDEKQNHKTEVSNAKVYDDILSEIEPEARAEIFELFASSSSGKRLERLLKARNMSLEELIALRQRGSSKVHLADVSRLREQIQKYPRAENENSNNEQLERNEAKEFKSKAVTENSSNVETDKITNTAEEDHDKFRTETFFDTHMKDNSMLKLIDLFHGERSTENPRMVILHTTEQEKDVELENKKENTRERVEILDLLTTFASLPFSKDQYLNSATEYSNYADLGERKLSSKDDEIRIVFPQNIDNSRQSRTHSLDSTQAVFEEDFVNKVPLSIDLETISGSSQSGNDANITSNEKKDLSRIKPSIIASGAILGVTLVVFLAILIACRVRQKQKYTYSNTFSRAVFQGPVMAARKLSNSSTLSTVMVNVISTSTAKRSDRHDEMDGADEFEPKSDIDNDSLDANDSWETIPDYLK